MRLKMLTVLTLVLALVVTACATKPTPTPRPSPTLKPTATPMSYPPPGSKGPKPTPTPTPRPPSAGVHTPEDMRGFIDELPEEIKLVVDEDVVIHFTEPEAMLTRDVPVHWWHIPSMSVVWHCPRGLSLRGRLLCEYTGIKKFYKSEEGAARLDELLRDEELERRIRARLSELYSLVWAKFDRAIPLGEAIEILSISAKQVLEDDDWGFANEEVCAEIHGGGS
jgi:hypothetical protein